MIKKKCLPPSIKSVFTSICVHETWTQDLYYNVRTIAIHQETYCQYQSSDLPRN